MARKMKMSRPTSRQHPATSRFDYGPPQLKYAKKIAEAQKNRYSRNPRNRQGVRHRREHRRGPQGVSLPAAMEASAQFGNTDFHHSLLVSCPTDSCHKL